MKLHHFYHIYADGRWLEPVSEHMRALKDYGLYTNLASFHVGMVGNVGNRAAVHQYLESQGLHYNIADQQPSGWEQVTQIPMWQFSKHNDGAIIYAHSKGASDASAVNIRWRRSMIYWNIIRWRDCVERLKQHDACGCHWIQPFITGMPEHKQGNFMFAGTFFWAKAATMRQWDGPALNHRHEAEGFIGYGWHAKPFPVYDFTPYFPNTNTFYDDWVNNHSFTAADAGKSYTI